MSHIDIINLYKDYINLGKSQEEATLLIKSMDINTMDFVTKTELAYQMSELKSEIRQDFSSLKQDFGKLKTDIKWMWCTIILIGTFCVVPFIQSIHTWWVK